MRLTSLLLASSLAAISYPLTASAEDCRGVSPDLNPWTAGRLKALRGEGLALKQSGKLPEASEKLEQALRLFECNAQVLHELASVQEALGRPAQAYENHRKAASFSLSDEFQKKLPPGERHPWMAFRDRAAEAVERLRPTISVQLTGPEAGSATVTLDGVEWQSPGVVRAVEPGEHTVVLRGPGLKERSETFDLQAGERPRAITVSTEALEILAPPAPDLDERSRVDFQEGLREADDTCGAHVETARKEKALAAFDRVVRARPKDQNARYDRARCAFALGRFPEAHGDFHLVQTARDTGRTPAWVLARAQRFAAESKRRAVDVAIELSHLDGSGAAVKTEDALLRIDAHALSPIDVLAGGRSLFVAMKGAAKDPTRIRNQEHILTEPGTYDITVTRDGFSPWRNRVRWDRAGSVSLIVRLDPEPAPDHRPRDIGLGLLGAGAVSVIGGAILAGAWSGENDAASVACSDVPCSNRRLAAAERASILGVASPVAFGLGAASAVVGVLVWRPWRAGRAPAVALGPMGLSMSGAF